MATPPYSMVTIGMSSVLAVWSRPNSRIKWAECRMDTSSFACLRSRMRASVVWEVGRRHEFVWSDCLIHCTSATCALSIGKVLYV